MNVKGQKVKCRKYKDECKRNLCLIHMFRVLVQIVLKAIYTRTKLNNYPKASVNHTLTQHGQQTFSW